MSIGVGGSTIDAELTRLSAISVTTDPLPRGEFDGRPVKARALMNSHEFDAIYLSAGSNLYYFTGTKWYPSERMVGAILTSTGSLDYIVPAFEKETFSQYMLLDGNINCWQEHESPFELFISILKSLGLSRGRIGIDEATPFHHFGEISQLASDHQFVDARSITAGCRSRKSDAEIRLMQTAMDMTLEVHKSAARILRPGISTTEVDSFIDEAHRAIGASGGSTFCAVQFGEATAYPHGVPDPQVLADGDIVLIDTGCLVQNYHSDITRTYVFGEPGDRHREVWNAEKAAQATAFAAADIGVRCGDVDIAARSYLESLGYGPDYAVPGLPHRTGHGIGLDIHEWPYLVRSEDTILDAGMCFSNEPMLCLYGEFGVRLEDHFYMTEQGPKWFTNPSHSIDDPFGPGSD
jgi:Xaa-Pro dipeptidase